MRHAGQLDRAAALHERALKTKRAKLGEDHPTTLMSLHNLAATFGDLGQVDRAIPLHEQALKACRAKLGEDHPRTLIAQRGLARTYEKARRYRDAEPLFRKTVQAAGREEPRNDSFYSDLLASLGRCLIRQARHAEAVAPLRECLEVQEKIQPGAWTTAQTRSLLGEALAGQREFLAAEPLLLDAQKALTERRGTIRSLDRDAPLRDAAERLVRLYEAWGKPEKATAWKAKLGMLDLPADVFDPR